MKGYLPRTFCSVVLGVMSFILDFSLAIRQGALGMIGWEIRVVEALRFLEIGQALLVGPSWIAKASPLIVIRRRSPVVHHGIDRAGTPKEFSSRLLHDPSIGVDLSRGFELPIVRAVNVQNEHGGRHGRGDFIRVPGLEDEDFDVGVFCQATRNHTSSTSA